MTDLATLADKIERLTGPDRELDTLIHFSINRKWIGRIPTWPPTKIERPAMERGLAMHIEGDGYFYGDDVPHYTASLDAAMTLEIGRASLRERVCKYVEISVDAVSLKKQKTKKRHN